MKQRIFTAVMGIPLVLALIFWQGFAPLALFVSLIGGISLLEAGTFVGEKLPYWLTGAYAMSLFGVAWYLDSGPIAANSLAGSGILLSVLTAITMYRASQGTAKALFLAASGIYMGLPLVAISVLHQMLESEQAPLWNLRNLVLLLLLPIWAGDTAGILFGKRFGKHRLAPTVSPNKTIEGSVANLLAALITGYVTGVALGLPWGVSLGIGATCGVLGQIGDLFESSLKRNAGVKDSGTILPGHGGVFDRIDSLLASALPVLVLLTLTLPRP